ncbi:MAG: hypothetical protein IT532_06940 [Burkholderiales bacterium]|nr:hypothetical protein [Burkholderiales bacterium]
MIVRTSAQQAQAWELAARRYAWRQYEFSDLGVPFPDARRAPHYTTLLARQHGRPVATITVGLDNSLGLLVDQANAAEVAALRNRGARIAEVVRLAIEDAVDSKQVWLALLESLVAFGMAQHQRTDILIEVNPRHVPFYRRVFGFEPLAPERTCLRVGAPSRLLRLTRETLYHKLAASRQAPLRVAPPVAVDEAVEEAVAA